MKAQEMFEELEYELVKDARYGLLIDPSDADYYIIFEHPKTLKVIAFNLEDKFYSVMNFKGRAEDVWIEEHQAITQQLKELGWLK